MADKLHKFRVMLLIMLILLLFSCAKLMLYIEYGDEHTYEYRISHYTEALEKNPRDAKAYYNRGIAYDKKGGFDRARALSERRHFDGASYDQAISDFNKVLEINPKLCDYYCYYHRGHAYGEKGQYDQAISDFNRAIEIKPRDAEAYGSRGVVYARKGQYDEAISDYSKALEINPKGEFFSPFVYTRRGILYREKGQYDQAISDFNKAIKMYPLFDCAIYNRAIAYEKKGEYDLAISDYNKILGETGLYKDSPEAYYNRGRCYYFKKEYDKSWDDVKRAQHFLGYEVPAEFLEDLRKASGRQN